MQESGEAVQQGKVKLKRRISLPQSKKNEFDPSRFRSGRLNGVNGADYAKRLGKTRDRSVRFSLMEQVLPSASQGTTRKPEEIASQRQLVQKPGGSSRGGKAFHYLEGVAGSDDAARIKFDTLTQQMGELGLSDHEINAALRLSDPQQLHLVDAAVTSRFAMRLGDGTHTRVVNTDGKPFRRHLLLE
jgi:hypothetical protein